ncbi:Fanconi anemia group G protein homolog [Glandiceps talaboti]
MKTDMLTCVDLTEKYPRNAIHMTMWLSAKYMLGYLYYQENQIQKCLTVLQEILQTPVVDRVPRYTAIVMNLMGCCLAKQGKHQTAIHNFSESLHEYFHYTTALYNIALQYRQLQLYDAELETWNLIITIMENKETDVDRSDSNQDLVMEFCPGFIDESKCVQLTRPKSELNITLVLYIMARRCLELQRYDVAAQRYLDLLAILMDHSIIQINGSNGLGFHLPDITTIFKETVSALLLDHRYNDVIVVSEQVVSKMTTQVNHKLKILRRTSDFMSSQSSTLRMTNTSDTGEVFSSGPSDISEQTEAASRKRMRSQEELFSSSFQDDDKELVNVVEVLMMQSEALMKLNQCKETLKCLDDGCGLLCDLPRHKDCDLVSMEGVEFKRRRLNTDGDQTSVKAKNSNNVLLNIKSQAYNNKALILISEGKHKEALETLLLSIQSNPGNQDAVYNHTVLLLQLSRHQEAVTNWLHFRDIDGHMDNMQINQLCKKKAFKLRSLEDERSTPFENQLLKLDQVVLQQLIKLKTNRHSFSL